MSRTFICQRRLRAIVIVEVVDGEVKVFSIANSDQEHAAILDALRFVIEEGGAR